MILLVGASASGKTEIAKSLSKKYGIKKAITNTTREKRDGEINGVDYYFLSREEFLNLKEKDKLVESTIYNCNYYGCSKSEIGENKCIVLEPEGIASFLKLVNKDMVTFLLLAKEETRIKRMKNRGDSIDSINKRIETDKKRFDLNRIGKVDFVIETDGKPIDLLAKQIYDLYQNHLKKYRN